MTDKALYKNYKKIIDEMTDKSDLLVGVFYIDENAERKRKQKKKRKKKNGKKNRKDKEKEISIGYVKLDKTDRETGESVFYIRTNKDIKSIDGLKVLIKPAGRVKEKVYGKIVEVLGDPSDPEVILKGILKENSIRETFPKDVVDLAEKMPVSPSSEEIAKELSKGRRDLRNVACVTIDGADARDFDDAVDIEMIENGNYLLRVHIADVAHYVSEGNAFDFEALRRGNSVYLPSMVIPMLPEALSNGLCSLKPGEDRLAVTAEMQFDTAGNFLHGELFESIIQSSHRLTYKGVQAILKKNGDETGLDKSEYAEDLKELPELQKDFKDDPDLEEEIMLMYRLSRLLEKQRADRGSLDFDSNETTVKIDENGIVTGLYLDDDAELSEEIIENFMIAANEFVARLSEQEDVQILYRIHEDPVDEKFSDFLAIASGLGLTIDLPKNRRIEPRDLRKLMQSFEDLPYSQTLSHLLLRSMAKARYDAANLGHFGLASESYAHFTAPIRRYSDLFTHRALKKVIGEKGALKEDAAKTSIKKQAASPAENNGDMGGKFKPGDREAKKEAAKKSASRALAEIDLAAEVAIHISEAERNAVSAERDAVMLSACLYYEDKVGEVYDATVTGFTDHMFFAGIDQSGIEGAVMFRDLKGYYELDREHFRAVCKEKKAVIRIGDPVKLMISSVDINRRLLNFQLVEHKSAKSSHSEKN